MKPFLCTGALMTACVSFAQADFDKSLANVGLLNVPPVVKALKLTAAQDKKIKDVRQDKQLQIQKLDAEAKAKPKEAAEIAKRARALSREFDLKIVGVLDATQLKRLREASIQVLGANALTVASVQERLKLTAEQRKKVGELEKQYKQKQHAAHQADALKKAKDKKPGEMAANLKAIGAEYSASIKKVLTEAQLKTFRELQGQAIPGLVVTSVKI